ISLPTCAPSWTRLPRRPDQILRSEHMAVRRRLPGVEEPRTEIVSRPVSTYARPEAPELPPDALAQADLLQLARSLSGTSDALASFAATYTRATAEEGQNAALGLNLQKPKEEVARMLTMPGGVPPNVNRRILEIGNGERYAQANIEDIRRRYN